MRRACAALAPIRQGRPADHGSLCCSIRSEQSRRRTGRGPARQKTGRTQSGLMPGRWLPRPGRRWADHSTGRLLHQLGVVPLAANGDYPVANVVGLFVGERGLLRAQRETEQQPLAPFGHPAAIAIVLAEFQRLQLLAGRSRGPNVRCRPRRRSRRLPGSALRSHRRIDRKLPLLRHEIGRRDQAPPIAARPRWPARELELLEPPRADFAQVAQ